MNVSMGALILEKMDIEKDKSFQGEQLGAVALHAANWGLILGIP